MKKFLALVAALPLLIGGFAACGSSDDGAQYAGVCVDPNTNVRVDDSNCSGGGGSGGMSTGDFMLMYMLMSSSHPYPAYGGYVNHNYFVTHIPSGGSYVTGLPRSGGSSLRSYAKKTYGSSYRAPASKSYTSPGKKVTTSKPKSSFGGGTSTKKKSGGWSFGGSSSRKSGGFGGGMRSGRR